MAQEISTEVIPSEEELLEALTNGEIDYETYLLLYDLLVNGVDSTQKYLLEQIPGAGGSQADQQRGFVSDMRPRAGKRAVVRYRFGGELEDSGRTKYRITGKFLASQNWVVDFGAAKEYSGNERVLKRSLTYTANSSTWLSKVTIGSVRARFGLGSMVGYRGKLLDFSDQLDGESFLCPDGGGFNGVLLEGGSRNVSVSALGSYQRDASYTLTTVAMQGTATATPFRPSAIAAVHTIENRGTGNSTQVYQAGFNLSRKWKPGSVAWEISGQTGERSSGAIVVSADHKWRHFDLNMNGWSYGDGYLGLAAGSRAASLSATDEIESVDFKFSDRRAGQTGAQLQGRAEIASKYSVHGDLLAAERGADTSTMQALVALEREVGDRRKLRLDVQYKSTEKAGDSKNTRRRGRAEWALSQRDLRIRTAIGFSDETTDGQYWSVLLQASGGGENKERWQVWSNWRRVAHGRIDYWHGFVSLTEHLVDWLHGSIKFTDTYSRSSVPQHSPSLILELQVEL